ncbi:MAG: G3E family GTPase [Verrucomicrobiales bacterium]|jgi:G3E family GTPase
MDRARYIMIGGFLGAGKTTSIQEFAKYLDGKGIKVGLITNDQGVGLVDTVLGKANRFPVEEIAGGCFCCRFDSLIDAAANLSTDNRPDVFLAEPVGSCTDLVATVSLPLQQIYGDDYIVAPLSVVIDPVRARRVLGLEEGKKLSANVCYIYEKQLEEAEIIVVNKVDLLDSASLGQLQSVLAEKYPTAEIITISARAKTNLDQWFQAALTGESKPLRVMEVDYDRYGKGEALLGWLNTTLKLSADDEEFDGNRLLKNLAKSLRTLLRVEDIEVAHLKMTLNSADDPYEIGSINLVRSDDEPHSSHQLTEPLEEGELSLNIRAEAAPEILESATVAALDEVFAGLPGINYQATHMASFRPGYPTPIHRVKDIK